MNCSIKKPNANEIEAIWTLINSYVQTTQELLPRSSDHILEHLRDFWIAKSEVGEIIGCASLFLWSAQLSEIKSLAVHPDWQGKGVGKALVQRCLIDAQELGQTQVFALTFKPNFFYKLGFQLTERNNLPHKVWNECIHCPKLLNCGEIAVIHYL